MKKCTNCGKLNHDSSKFCLECGHRLEETKEANNVTYQTIVTHKTNIIDSIKSFISQTPKLTMVVVALVAGAYALNTGYDYLMDNVDFGLSSRASVKDSQKSSWLPFISKTTAITNVIVNGKRDIQQLAVAETSYSVKKDQETRRNLLLFDYTTQKFLCDVDIRIKYGYDLSALNKEDISVNSRNKEVVIHLPKGMIISNEILGTQVRHNEGFLASFGNVKAEEMDAVQQSARQEAQEKALKDQGLISMAEANTRRAFQSLVDTVEPGYTVKVR